MKTHPSVPDDQGYRFPPVIISHAVWLYFRFSLSYRDVEELLAQRGIVVTYAHGAAVVPQIWTNIRGMNYVAAALVVAIHGIWTRSSSLSAGKSTIYGGRWIKTGTCWISLYRAAATRKAANRFFRKILKGLQYVPRVIITDKLRSYGAAKRELLPGVEHRQHKGMNTRAENSHQPTRLREKKMRTFKSAGHAQRFRLSHLVPSPNIFNREDIVCVPGSIVLCYKGDSRCGVR